MKNITVKVKEEEDAHKILSVEVSSSRVKEEKDRILNQFQKKAKIPGFRAGKAPRKILESNYEDDIKQELLETIINGTFREIIEEHKYVPISYPRFSNVESSLDSSMSFEAAFDVRPEVEIKRYTGFKIEKKMQEVSDTSVDGVLERLRKERAVTRPAERPARTGDRVSIEYVMMDTEGNPVGGEDKKTFDVVLGEGGVLEEIEKNLTDMCKGEEKQISVTYPEDYFAEQLRGMTKVLQLTITDIREVETPDLDDDFARSIDPSKDLAALRDDIRNRLFSEMEHNANNEVVENLIDLIIEANPFDPPRIIVDNYLDEFLERMRQEREKAGEEFDPEKVREPYRPSAIRAFKKRFVVNAIADTENLTATDEDVDRELEAFSKGMNRPIDSLRKELESEDSTMDNFKSEITLKKITDFLTKNSEVREKYE